MLNQIVLVGRLTSEPTLQGEYKATIELAIPRSYKNEEGIYETDFVTVSLYNGIAKNTCEYCKKGDLVGIKGRIQSNEDKSVQIIAEKVTFLSSNKVED